MDVDRALARTVAPHAGLSIHCPDGECRMILEGEIDLTTAPLFESEGLRLIAEHGARRIVCELGGVSFLDSTGLCALLAIRKQAQSTGCGLVLRAPSPAVMRVLEVTKLTGSFEIEASA
jgi:anti-sigma B factor antagonist